MDHNKNNKAGQQHPNTPAVCHLLSEKRRDPQRYLYQLFVYLGEFRRY